VWHAMFAEQIPLAEKVLRTVIVYALIVVLFRLTGKRGLASMNTFDVVVADVDESLRPGESPSAYVRRLAADKSAAARSSVASSRRPRPAALRPT